MRTVIIHVGMEKTGSTSLQNLLAANRAKLSAAGISFPALKNGANNHNFIASCYIPEGSPLRSRGLSKFGTGAEQKRALADIKDAFFREVRKSGKVVISGEHLFRLEPAQVQEFADDLHHAGVSESGVFGVLRHPASFFMSFAQQELKASSKLPSVDMTIPYSERVAGWRRAFACDFVDFDAARSSTAGLMRTSLDAIARVLGPLPDLPQDVPPVNETLSPEEMQILQDYRRANFPKDDGKFNRDTSRLLRTLIGMRDGRWRRPKLAAEVERHVCATHAVEGQRLKELTGIDFRLAPSDQRVLDAAQYLDASSIVGNFDSALHRELLARLSHRLMREPSYRMRLNWLKRLSR